MAHACREFGCVHSEGGSGGRRQTCDPEDEGTIRRSARRLRARVAVVTSRLRREQIEARADSSTIGVRMDRFVGSEEDVEDVEAEAISPSVVDDCLGRLVVDAGDGWLLLVSGECFRFLLVEVSMAAILRPSRIPKRGMD